ncbi:MAG: helix-turn-helix transcriptional regulator [Desulfosporosinus sp.]|nr:helix-turn-helix transcriptional regulator [Desulfosporosinus sp.]
MSEKRQMIYGGQKMRNARLKAAIGTQKELAERTGIPANIISDLERGKRQMSPSWAKRIAEAVGGSWTDFIE